MRQQFLKYVYSMSILAWIIWWLGIQWVSAGSLSSNRNNDGFLQQSFWTDSPTTGEIVNAVYGDANTAYSAIWSGWNTCIPGNMSVVYLNSGTNTIPTNLSSNTIYVLSGTYNTSLQIRMWWSCTALVGATPLTSVVKTTDGSFITISGSNIILDNLLIDGNDKTNGVFEGITNIGIDSYVFDGQENISMNNISSYNAGRWIETRIGWYHIYITNSNIFNNVIGIDLDGTHRVLIHNSHIFNNEQWFALSTNGWTDIVIANSQIYNNDVLFYNQYSCSYTDKITINNTQIYNNSDTTNCATILSAAAVNMIASDFYYNANASVDGTFPIRWIGRFFANDGIPGDDYAGLFTSEYDPIRNTQTWWLITGLTMSAQYHALPRDVSNLVIHNNDPLVIWRDVTRDPVLPLSFNYTSTITRKQVPLFFYSMTSWVCSDPFYTSRQECVSNFGTLRSWDLYVPNVVIDTGNYIWQPSYGPQSPWAPASVECFDLTPANVANNQSAWFPSLCTKVLISPASWPVWLIVPISIEYINSTLSALTNQQFRVSWFPIVATSVPSAVPQSRQLYGVYFKSYAPDNVTISP